MRPFPALPLPHILPLAATVAAVTVNGKEESVPDIALFWKIACTCQREKLKLYLLSSEEPSPSEEKPERLTQESSPAAGLGLHSL